MDSGAPLCVFVTVVRDRGMYSRLVRDNPCNAGAEFVAFDNLAENLSVTRRYNSFLESWDYSREAWFVFLHEDYEFLEPVAPILGSVGRRCIYGTCGARSTRPGDDVAWALNSNRDGTQLGVYGRPFAGQPTVLTSDCNCMMVHSSLVRELGLRFDERLTFDLYVEDFEIAAFERFGIPTKVLGVLNHHYSFGNIAPRFFVQRGYLMEKYADASRAYGTTTKQVIGPVRMVLAARLANRRRRRTEWLRRLLRLVWRVKHSRDGRVRVRLLGLPLRFMAAGRYAPYLDGRGAPAPAPGAGCFRKGNSRLVGSIRLLRFKVAKGGGTPAYHPSETPLWTFRAGRSVFALVRQEGPLDERRQVPLASDGNALVRVRLALVRAVQAPWLFAAGLATKRRKYSHFLLLGYNCELAYRFLKANGFLDATLFGWAYIPSFGATLDVLGRLEGFFAGELSPRPRSGGMFVDGATGVSLHSRLGADAELCPADEVERAKDELRSRVAHLREKFLRQLRDDEPTLAVVKMRPEDCPEGDGNAHRLLDALRALGGRNVQLLVVCQKADAAHFPSDHPDYFLRTVSRYNPDWQVATEQRGDRCRWTMIWREFAPLRVLKQDKKYKFDGGPGC